MVKISNDQTPASLGADKNKPNKKLENAVVNNTNNTSHTSKNASDGAFIVQKDKLSADSLATIKASIQKAPEINESLVKDIRDKIQKGQYQVDFKQLAEKMVKASFEEDV